MSAGMVSNATEQIIKVIIIVRGRTHDESGDDSQTLAMCPFRNNSSFRSV